MKKVTIMHLMPSANFSGAEKVACQIIELFAKDELYRMVLVCKRGPIKKQLDDRDIEYVFVDAFNKKGIRKIVETIRPDVIHAHDFTASMLASQFKKIPVIAHLHNNPPWLTTYNIKSIAFATCIKRLSKIYGVSESVRQEYVFKELLKDRFEVLPNVVDLNEIRKKSMAFDVKDEIDVIFVGRLAYPKNPLKFLEIVKAYRDQGGTINALMLGEGDLRVECENFIEKNELQNIVQMRGFADNPFPYMNKAKILILPSEFEGFGLVAVEALLLNTPVLCSGVGGLVTIIDDTCGKICDSVEEYMYEMKRLLENKNYHQAKIKGAEKKVECFVDTEEYKRKLHDEYVKLVENQL